MPSAGSTVQWTVEGIQGIPKSRSGWLAVLILLRKIATNLVNCAGDGTTNYEYWGSVLLPQNFRVASFIDVAATFTTAVSIVLLLALLANNPKIEQIQEFFISYFIKK